MRQTTIIKPSQVQKEWFVVDADGQTLGKLSALVASVLRGKHKATFTPNVDMGDNVIVINAEKIVLTSDKETKKKYYTHSGYPGGLKERTAAQQRAHKPASLVEKSIAGMIPHTPLGRTQLRNLYVYEGPAHKHEAQQPKKLEVK